MQLLKAAIYSLFLLFGVWAFAPANALETTCPSSTKCRATCGGLSERLTCSTDGSRCTTQCGGRSIDAHCTSGSGTECFAYCGSGTVSLTCSDRNARCSGRCTDYKSKKQRQRALFLNDDVVPPSLAPRPVAGLRPDRAHHRFPKPPDLTAVFSGLVSDVWWSLGASGSPSSVAEELLATLRQAGDFAATGEFQGVVAGDRVTIKLGLPAEDLNAMFLDAEKLVQKLQKPRARRRYDAKIRQSADSER